MQTLWTLLWCNHSSMSLWLKNYYYYYSYSYFLKKFFCRLIRKIILQLWLSTRWTNTFEWADNSNSLRTFFEVINLSMVQCMTTQLEQTELTVPKVLFIAAWEDNPSSADSCYAGRVYCLPVAFSTNGTLSQAFFISHIHYAGDVSHLYESTYAQSR